MRARAPIRTGLLGFGRLAREYYLPALRAGGLAQIVAVADPLPEARAAARAQLPDATSYPGVDELLARERLDALLVASPPSTHLAAWRASAPHELPVFMEKPFLLPGELAAVDPGDPAWQRLMVDFNRRFWPPYRWLRDALRAGRIGRPLRARFVLRVDDRAWATVSDHRRRPGEGGALHDLGSQLLDLAATVLDEAPCRLRARRGDGPAAGELLHLELGFPSGARAECELGYAAGRARESVSIEGEGGVLRIDDPNFLPHLESRPSRLGRAAARGGDLAALAWRGLFRSRSMLRFTVAAALAAFFAALRDGARFEPGFPDALRVAGWLAAAERSLASGRAEALAAP